MGSSLLSYTSAVGIVAVPLLFQSAFCFSLSGPLRSHLYAQHWSWSLLWFPQELCCMQVWMQHLRAHRAALHPWLSSFVRSSVLRGVMFGEILPWGCPVSHLCWKSHWSFRLGSVRSAYAQLFSYIINILVCLLLDIPCCKPWCRATSLALLVCSLDFSKFNQCRVLFLRTALVGPRASLCKRWFSLQIMSLFHLSHLTYSWQKQGFKYFIAFFFLLLFLPDALKTLSDYDLGGSFQDRFPFLLDCNGVGLHWGLVLVLFVLFSFSFFFLPLTEQMLSVYAVKDWLWLELIQDGRIGPPQWNLEKWLRKYFVSPLLITQEVSTEGSCNTAGLCNK